MLLVFGCLAAQQAPAVPPAAAAPVAVEPTDADRAAAELAAHLDTEGEFAWTPILIELRGHGLAGARQMVPRLGSKHGMLAVLAAKYLQSMGPVAWLPLAEGLHHEDAGTRAGCAFVLSEFGPLVVFVVPQLAPLLDDPDERTAHFAAVALLLISPATLPEGVTRQDLVARVAAGLAHEDADRRREAITHLGRLAATESGAREALHGALRHEDLRVRVDAASQLLYAMDAAPSEEALDVVIDLIVVEPPAKADAEDPEAERARLEWPDSSGLLMLLNLRGSTPALVARLAARVAQETGDKYRYARAFTEIHLQAPELLAALVRETTACDEARFSAAWALGQQTRSHGLLCSMLSATDETTRVAAVYGLGKLGPYSAESLPDLERLLDDESSWVRETLATALGRIAFAIDNPQALAPVDERNARTLAAVPWLMKLANDETFPDASQKAYDALLSLGAPRVVPVLAERMASPETYWRCVAVQLAGELGYADPTLREPLETASRGTDPILRIFALASIGQLWDEVAVVPLLEREAVDADTRRRVRRELLWLQRSDASELAAAAAAALARVPEP